MAPSAIQTVGAHPQRTLTGGGYPDLRVAILGDTIEQVQPREARRSQHQGVVLTRPQLA